MYTWNIGRAVVYFVSAIFMFGCDFVPEATDAEQANGDRSQFQAPKNIVTTSGNSQVLIQWPSYPDATGYTLYWSNQSISDESNIQSTAVTNTQYLHVDLNNGIPYYYSISAQTERGESVRSEIVVATPDYPILPAVLIKRIVIGDERNTLEWEPVAGATAYTLYWSSDTNGTVTSQSKQINQVISPFVHENIQNLVSYNYRIAAINIEKVGTLSEIVSATPFRRPPMAPSSISMNYQNNALVFNFEDISNAESFDLYWSNQPDVGITGQQFTKIQSPFTHTPLQSGNKYYYRLQANNSGGASSLSTEIAVTAGVPSLMPGSRPPTPAAVNVGVGDSQLLFDWENVAPDVFAYNLYWSTTSGGGNGYNKIANIVPPYVITGLSNGVPIFYVLTAINNSGESIPTNEGVPAIPQIILPGVPANVTISSSDSKIAISWGAVSGATDYNVHWQDMNSSPTQNKRSNVSSPVLIENLNNGFTYSFQVSANNTSGVSERSNSVIATPQISRPLAPSQIVAQPGNNSVQLNWEHAYVASQSITGYRIYWSGSDIVNTKSTNYIDINDPTSTSYFHQELINNRLIYYVITALNAGGESALSAQIQAKPQVDIPNAPLQVAATPGNRQIKVNWQQQSGAENFNIYWWAEIEGQVRSTKTVVANVLPGVIVDGLQNGKAYHFTIAALNQAGESILSNEIIATPQVPAPTTTAAIFSAVASDSAVQLFWDDIPAASQYRIYWSSSSNISPITSAYISNQQSGYSQEGLRNGETYYYAIAGINAGGEGPLSAVKSAVPQVSAPNSPPLQFAVSAGTSEVYVSWLADLTANIAAYNVYATTDPATTWTLLAGFSSGSSQKNLRNGLTYYYRVAAVNAGGEGPLSDILSATPEPAPPATPNGLSVAVISDTELAINWQQIPGLKYTLHWSNNPSVPLNGTTSQSFAGAQAIFSHGGLTAGQTYFYVVTAQNSVTVDNPNPGPQSPASIEMSAIPTVVPNNTPAALTAVGSDSVVRVQWQDVTGSANYTLYWSNDPSIGLQLGSQLSNGNIISNATSPYNHVGVNNGSRYYYVVTATTASESLPSPVVMTVPQIPPVPAPTGILAMGGIEQVTIRWNMLSQQNYNIYWTTLSNTDPLTGTKISNVQSPYVHGGLANNTAISYVMTSQNAAGESLPSLPFTIIPGSNTAPTISQGLVLPLNEVIVNMSEDGVPIPFILDLSAFDNEGHSLTWSISRQATGTAVASVNGNGGIASVGYSAQENFNGSDTFEVQVTDELGAKNSILVTVNIDPVNDVPRFTTTPSSSDAVVGLNYVYDISVDDIDTPTSNLLISVLSKPIWLSLNSSTIVGQASLSGVPTIDDLGTVGNSVTLQVSDGIGGLTEQSFVLSVNNSNAVTLASNSTAIVLGSVTAGQESVITIQAVDTLGNARSSGGDDVGVVLAGNNANATIIIIDNGDGTYTARYTPTFSGNDSIIINIAGQPILNSPYSSNIIADKAVVANSIVAVPTAGTPGTPSVITVTARDGNGNESMGVDTVSMVLLAGSANVNVPMSVVYTGNGIYTGTYTPTVAGTDQFSISLNNSVFVGPFASTVSASEAVVATSTVAVPAMATSGTAVTITVTARDLNQNLSTGADSISMAIKLGSANENVTISVVYTGNGVYTGTYIPINAGTDNFTVALNNNAFAGPFTTTISAGSAILANSVVTAPAAGISGTALDISVTARDLNQNLSTGSDTVLITIDAGSVNAGAIVSVVYSGNGVYTGTYTPTIAGTDNFTVVLNNSAFAGSYATTISASSAIVANSTVSVPATSVSGAVLDINVTARDLNQNLSAGTDSVLMSVDVGSPNVNSTIAVVYLGNGVYNGTYTPSVAGIDSFTITLNNTAFPGPFSSSIEPALGDALKSTASVPSGIAGSLTTITVNVFDSSGTPSSANNLIVVSHTAGSANVVDSFSSPVNAGGVGVYSSSYTPSLPGVDTFTVTVNGVNIPPPNAQSTYSSSVIAGGLASNSTADIPTDIAINIATTISVIVRDINNNLTAGGDTVLFSAIDSNNSPISIANGSYVVSGINTGKYTTSYVPTVAGINSVTISVNGSQLLGSPFTSKIIDINGANAWVSVGAGMSYQSLAVKLDGSLWVWGNNNNFELGDGTRVDKNSAIPITTATTIARVYGGSGQSFAIDTNGDLWAWGNNFYGNLGDNTTISRSSPVRVDTTNSTVKWASMANGRNGSTVMGIRVDGTLWSWGLSVIQPDGTLQANQITPVQVGTEAGWAKVAVSPAHVMALKTDGRLFSWGQNNFGQLGIGSTSTTNINTRQTVPGLWSDVATGQYFTVAIKSDGSLWSWGSDQWDKLGNGAGGDSSSPVPIGIDPTSNATWVKVVTGQHFSIALKSDGTLWGWGDNRYGTTGDGTGDNSLTPPNLTKPIPVQIGTDKTWVNFSSGQNHTLATRADNSIWTWGANVNGELGIGTITTNTYQNAPVQIK